MQASVRVHQKPTQQFIKEVVSHSDEQESNNESLDSPADRFLVVIDPGHGGDDTGAIYRTSHRKTFEKDLTLALSRELRRALVGLGVPVIMTRNSDDKVSLDMRAAIAHRARGSLFLSVHMNSSTNPRTSGLETYVLNTSSNRGARRLSEIENGRGHQVSTLSLILADLGTTAHYKDSVRLACLVQQSLVAPNTRDGGRLLVSRKGGRRYLSSINNKDLFSPPKDRGVKQALFYLLMQLQMPSILVEAGFPSNPSENSNLSRPAYQRAWAERTARAVLAYKTGASVQKSCEPHK